jgi:hypothetical protein
MPKLRCLQVALTIFPVASRPALIFFYYLQLYLVSRRRLRPPVRSAALARAPAIVGSARLRMPHKLRSLRHVESISLYVCRILMSSTHVTWRGSAVRSIFVINFRNWRIGSLFHWRNPNRLHLVFPLPVETWETLTVHRCGWDLSCTSCYW